MQTATSRPERGHARTRWSAVALPVDQPGSLFALLLAFGIVNHTHTLAGLAASWANIGTWLMFAAAAAVLVRPSVRHGLLLLLAGMAIDVAGQLPNVVNHWLAFGALGAVAALVGLTHVLAGSTGGSSESSDQRTATTTMHLGAVAIVTIWIFAALHKLNTGFFDTVHSCAISHTNDLFELVGAGRPVGGGPISALLIVATIAVEIAIPALLVLRRSRLAGLALAIGFHLVMAINGHQTFSGLALALYLPFLPTPVVGRLVEPDRTAGLVWRMVQLGGLGLLALGALLNLIGRDYTFPELRRLPYLVVSTAVVLLVVRAWRSVGWTTVEPSLRSAQVAQLSEADRRVLRIATLAVVGALALNGLAPYLGVKSQLTFSMYSNLRVDTEASWNHAFIPSSVRVFGDDTDLVRVESTSPELPQLDGVAVNRFEVRRVLGDVCDGSPIAMSYRLGDEPSIVRADDVCATELAQPVGTIEGKLLRFRPEIEPNGCQW